MIELREPLEKLAIPPAHFTRHLSFPDPSKIRIYDDTLRDGEQMPGVAFSPEQKLELAKFLSDMGVHVMDVAFPMSSDSDRKGLQLIVQAQQRGEIRPDVEILAMCRAVKDDIDCVIDTVAAVGAKPDNVSVLILSTYSDLHIKYKLGRTLLKQEGRSESEWLDLPLEFYREANIKLITGAIRYARERGISRVEFASEDSSRGDVEYAVRWAKACVEAGGTRMCFSDTCGVFTPEGVDHYFPKLVAALGDVPITAHFHNDFGLGAINTVRAIHHGALYAGVTANGIGERAGNTSIHQFVMVLKQLYGVTLPGFRYDLLTELRRRIELASGIAVMPHEPIIGEGVFSHESGIHTAAIVIHPAIYQFIREEEVGGHHRFVFGKHSGAAAVESVLAKNKGRLDESGVEITAELAQRLLDRVKKEREEMIATGQHEEIVKAHYEAYHRLGISEEKLIEMAMDEKQTEG